MSETTRTSVLKSFDETAAEFVLRENLARAHAPTIALMLEQAWCDGVAYERERAANEARKAVAR